MGFTPCAYGCTSYSAQGQVDQSAEFFENPRDNHLPILKGLNRWRCGLMPHGFG